MGRSATESDNVNTNEIIKLYAGEEVNRSRSALLSIFLSGLLNVRLSTDGGSRRGAASGRGCDGASFNFDVFLGKSVGSLFDKSAGDSGFLLSIDMFIIMIGN